jgi:hypothetical protein
VGRTIVSTGTANVRDCIEAEAAKHFLLILIEELEPGFLRQLDVVSAGSDSSITGILKTMLETQRRLTLVGVYYGEVREKIAAEAALRWPHTFSPGIVAPERLLPVFVGSQANIVQAPATDPKRQRPDPCSLGCHSWKGSP